ncbi:hypothetical protein, partial [Streptococcus agalactiae]
LLSFTQPIEMKNPKAIHIPRSYIEIIDNPEEWPMTPIFQKSAERAKEKGWYYYTINKGGHWVMKTNPKELLNILMDVSNR